MDDLRDIRKRIRHRRFEGTSTEDSKRSHPLFKLFYRFMMLVMGFCVAILMILVNQKLNVVSMPAVLQNLKLEQLSSWLPFEGWFTLKEEAVSATPSYTLLKDNQYANGSNIAYNPYDGVVLHVQKNSNGKTTLSLKQDNGVIATYGNLLEVSIKQDERILKGRPLGTFEQYLTIDFLKNQKIIDLSTALSDAKT